MGRGARPGPLERASAAVHGARLEEYGHPADFFARVAGSWRATFGWDVSPEDVPLAMVQFKVIRLHRSPDHEDSATDIAGYIEAYEMTLERLSKSD
jgi:Domain of unknown function (DUF6378)